MPILENGGGGCNLTDNLTFDLAVDLTPVKMVETYILSL